jgi:hypothetical protein
VKGKFRIGFVVAVLSVAGPAFAVDSLLDPAPGPCAAALEGPDYVPGTDANGQPVDRADIGAERVPAPGQLLVPLPDGANRRRGRGGPGAPAYVTIEGPRLDRLLNPQGCPQPAAPPAAPKRR